MLQESSKVNKKKKTPNLIEEAHELLARYPEHVNVEDRAGPPMDPLWSFGDVCDKHADIRCDK